MDQLVIISNFNFKSRQGAAFSRLLCYSLALTKDFNVYITSRYGGDGYDFYEKEPILNNLFLLSAKQEQQKSKLYRLLFRHFDFAGSYKYLRNIRRALQTDQINNTIFLFYSSELALSIVALIFLKILKHQKVFIEKSELETGIVFNQNIPFRLKGLLMLLFSPIQLICSSMVDFIAPLFSGIIVISKKLEKLYGRFSNNILYVPILADISAFKFRSPDRKSEHFLFGYTGSISKKKDGIFEFVRALGMVTESCRGHIRLNIFGEGSKEDVDSLMKLIVENKLEKNIFFEKMVPAQNVPELLCKHDLLILTRSSNIQTEYGFSTKLAEYLAAGIPVLATKVSDNSIYLKDEENALLVEPGDINAIALKIQYACNNRSLIVKIGHAGRKTAEKYFHYGLYSDQLKKFLLN